MFHFEANKDEKSSKCYRWNHNSYWAHITISANENYGICQVIRIPGKKQNTFDLHDLFCKFFTSSGGALGLFNHWPSGKQLQSIWNQNTFTGMNSLLAFTSATTLSTVLRDNRQIPRLGLFPFVILIHSWVFLVVVVSNFSSSLMLELQTFLDSKRSCMCARAEREGVNVDRGGDEFNRWQAFVGCNVWLPILGNMSCRPSSSPPAISLDPSANATRARSEATLACTQWKHSLLQHLSLMCIIKDLSPPLLPGPKATIVFVVVIDIVFHPYNTKQSDHDSDANAEVERVF